MAFNINEIRSQLALGGARPTLFQVNITNPANSSGDDIILHNKKLNLYNLRQQIAKRGGKPNYCLSDFIAPIDSGKKDWIGGFAVTAGFNVEKIGQDFADNNDDYKSIMIKVLGDRIAEGLAEKMHEKVRTELWGYSKNECLNNEDLIKEKYVGIRPAPGYPSCPDHSEKLALFDLLDIANNSKLKLTESYAVYPASSVSGWYFSHPDSRYFGISRICLLYTSPSPRDATLSRMPSSA